MAKKAKTSRSGLVTRDIHIRKVLLHDLELMYSDKDHDLIVEEFGCNTARVDVAVINGSLHAFEIKSDSDSLDRLPSQVAAYQGVFQYITLVCGRRLLSRARAVIPQSWGLQKAELIEGQVVLKELRAPKLNPKQDALSLAQMLWKKEAIACLRRHGRKVVTDRHSAAEVWQAVADNLPIAVLSDEVRHYIKVRGGSGFVKQSVRRDDSYTTESIVPVSRFSDLSWLLSQPSDHRHD